MRPATARSLAQFLPHTQSPLATPPLSPHFSHDRNSPILLQNRLALQIGMDSVDLEASPSLGSRKVKLHLGSVCPVVVRSHWPPIRNLEEDRDFLITLHILQNLMPYDPFFSSFCRFLSLPLVPCCALVTVPFLLVVCVIACFPGLRIGPPCKRTWTSSPTRASCT